MQALQKLKENELFAVMNRDGDIPAGSTDGQGVYYQDTRFLSVYELSVRGVALQLLSSTGELNFMSNLQFGNAGAQLADGTVLPARTLSVRRNRFIDKGLHERIGLFNYNPFPLSLWVDLALGSDFRDMFEIRSFMRPVARGTEAAPELDGATVWLRYTGRDEVARSTRIDFDRNPDALTVTEPIVVPVQAHPGEDRADTTSAPSVVRAVFRADLPPRASWSLAIHVAPFVGTPPQPGEFSGLDESFNRVLQAHHAWEETCTEIRTDHAVMNALIRQNLHDLRLTMNQAPTGLLPVAGIPWFSVPFGRDSLITSLQSLGVNPEIAAGTLRFLALHQGTQVDPWRDEEPGKILHEMRSGELASLGEVPHTPYYASIDATPLFVYLLCQYVKWTDDWALATELRPNLERAIEWLVTYGDRDGDGLLEYAAAMPDGMRHHAWKDSFDSVQFPDGAAAEAPIAPIEVQGYAYAAESGMAEIYEHWGEKSKASELIKRAQRRKQLFDQVFWLDSLGFYAQALDAGKRPIPAVTSNPGHCLLMGILPRERAEVLARRFLGDDLLSGWGIRTLSTGYPTFNPMSYHNGSVWPHDNSMIVAGLRHTGYDAAALKVMAQVFEAGMRLPDYRLPELYCGFGRDYRYHSAPASYPTACSPQGWAAASVFLMLQHLVGLEPDVPKGRVRIRPALLPWLDELHMADIRVGKQLLSVHVWRQKYETRWEVEGADGLTLVTQ
ncbi:MAG: amylo-alpha-1,6-glucosidase [Chloroflexi bacterium]|nr:amylo-alpha-1,6-glucosidase [Chloroflexota bacterium]